MATCFTLTARGQSPAASEQSLAAGRAALQQHRYSKAIRILGEGLRNSPNDSHLKLELGRAYLYDHKDARAIQLFKEVLSDDPTNREDKLELARALGYNHDYETSDRLYYDLLETNRDEDAEVGFIRNLMHEDKAADARTELQQALSRAPGSRRLLVCERQLDHHRTLPIDTERLDDSDASIPEGRENLERLGETFAYFSDSAGNRSLLSSEQFDYGYARKFFSRTTLEENSLQQNSGPKANILRAINEVRLQPLRNLTLAAGGGAVRFADGASIGLFQGELGYRLQKTLTVSGGYSRDPVTPTFLATQFKLLSQGWHTGLNWRPQNWSLSTSGSSQHYSDGNDSRSADAELIRVFGTPRIAFIAGYRFSYLGFDKILAHGYFDPSKYQTHLGGAGISFAGGRYFRGDYSVHAGGQSLNGAPFQPAWDVAFRNRLLLQQWELGATFSYSQLAQSSGAFNSQTSAFVAAYRF